MKTKDLYEHIFQSTSDGVIITDLETGKILVSNPTAAEMHKYSLAAFTELRIQRLLHAKSLPFFGAYAEVILAGGLFEMLAQHMRRDDVQISVEWRAVSIHYQGKTCALAMLRDVSKRVLAEQQLQQRVGARAKEQAILLEISRNLAATLEVNPSLILDQLGLLIKYTHASLFTLENSTLVASAVRDANGLDITMTSQAHINGKQAIEKLFHDRHPIRIAELWSNEPSALFLRSLLEKDSSLLHNVHSWMWVPLAANNRILGCIGIAHAERNYFSTHHADLAMTIANQAAVTLVNAELYEHAQELAALQERQRLAQNLHDAVNQSLFSAGLIAEVLPRLWERDQQEARRSLESLRRLTHGAQAEMRVLLAELHPSTLTDADFGDLLRLLINAFSGKTSIPVKLTINGEPGLPAKVQVALYRICQEALNNIAKHAKASQVNMDVQSESWGMEVQISDNGRGFQPSEIIPSGHYGLAMMHERAEAAGITLKITSQPKEGSLISLRWQKHKKN